MNDTEDLISFVYEHLETHKCLCNVISEGSIRDLWNKMLQECFEKSAEETSDSQLLCISFLQLTGEVYINVTVKYQSVCSHVLDLFEIFLSDELWIMFVNHLKFSQNKHLVYVFIKALSTILSASHESMFCQRIQALLDDMKDNIFSKSNTNVLDFLSNLAQYSFKTYTSDFNIKMCDNISPKTICLFEDLFQSLCTLLSQYWRSFMKQYHELISSKCNNENLISFLTLWQRIIGKLTEQDLLHMYLNEDCIITFLSYAYNLDVISLRIYVDIIMQYFTNGKFASMEENYSSPVEEIASAALGKKFFELLPSDIHLSGLCILINSKYTESVLDSHHVGFSKCDPVIVKKITYIFLNLISGYKNSELICDAIVEVFCFVKQNSGIPSSEPVHVWINDVFIDQDDILLGVMLALLKIYISLKRSPIMNFSKHIELQNHLNPHEIFIHFLQRLGFDHNELVAFLTSDETCFLLYLMKYSKLLLQEWDMFIKAHDNLIKADEDVFECNFTNTDQEKELYKLPSSSPLKKLVSYSSSSSEEDTSIVAHNESTDKNILSQDLIVLVTLVKLKETLRKLVSTGEFPYTISPLISLLQTCENNVRS